MREIVVARPLRGEPGLDRPRMLVESVRQGNGDLRRRSCSSGPVSMFCRLDAAAFSVKESADVCSGELHPGMKLPYSVSSLVLGALALESCVGDLNVGGLGQGPCLRGRISELTWYPGCSKQRGA